MHTYIVFIKTEESGHKTVKIKASGYTMVDNGVRVNFEGEGKNIAVFTMASLVGFVRDDHIVN